MQMNFNGFSMKVDYKGKVISSLMIGGKERLAAPTELFSLCLRNQAGEPTVLCAGGATACELTDTGAIYTGFTPDVRVFVGVREENGEAVWHIEATPLCADYFVEWVEFPSVTLPKLRKNNTEGNGGDILFPYNEGALVSDAELREEGFLRYWEAAYPSRGVNAVFPNMVFAQMLAYVWDDVGLYIGLHDEGRGVKDINFCQSEQGVRLRFRIYTGVDFGERFASEYPIVFAVTEGRWEACAERYRTWFEENLPKNVKKSSQNDRLPSWYADSPLVVTYPVRGVHDMDEMKPNRMFPYINAMGRLESIRSACESRLLVLLMHWEGTAPWAPPYVWPPYGGTEGFEAFRDALHERGDMLGVYCSGFDYTIQSNLIAEYNNAKEYERLELVRGMCADADGVVKISDICTGQRSGYDICPASEVGRELLAEAYAPLFASGIDYAQILDQNHGGGQYFCYSREHGHSPAPGTWMTENMQSMLTEWNDKARGMLFGCESSAAEPFVGNLLFSDNRFELNYRIGLPVPLYAYIYHEYLRNFMGNQVCCPLSEEDDDNLIYRMAYSFTVGDSMTLILDQDGNARSWWGKLDTDHIPNQEKILRLVRNLMAFYREEAKAYLLNGRMTMAEAVECDTLTFPCTDGKCVCVPEILTSAWESEDGKRAQILVNPTDKVTSCRVKGEAYTLAPLSAMKIMLG